MSIVLVVSWTMGQLNQIWRGEESRTEMEVVLHAVTKCHDTEDNVPDRYCGQYAWNQVSVESTYEQLKDSFRSTCSCTIELGRKL